LAGLELADVLLRRRLEVGGPVVEVLRPARDRVHVLVLLVVLEYLGREEILRPLRGAAVQHVARLEAVGCGPAAGGPGEHGARDEPAEHRCGWTDAAFAHDPPRPWRPGTGFP